MIYKISQESQEISQENHKSDYIMSALENPPTMPAAWNTAVDPWVTTSANVHQIHHHAYQPYPHQG